MTVLAGDFNFGSVAMHGLTPESDVHGAAGHNAAPVAPAGWRELLGQFTECQIEDPTRYHHGLKRLSDIDRVFLSCPGWVLAQCSTGGE
eukprot:9488072-Pyramimonas_sp.AAC.1